jgi:hypothetical protein
VDEEEGEIAIEALKGRLEDIKWSRRFKAERRAWGVVALGRGTEWQVDQSCATAVGRATPYDVCKGRFRWQRSSERLQPGERGRPAATTTPQEDTGRMRAERGGEGFPLS